jgi:predicted ATPase
MQRLCTEIVLEPLPKAGLIALLARELGQPTPPPTLLSFVRQHAEGNPLFTISILQHLIAQRLLFRNSSGENDGWELRADFEKEAGVPDELAQMVELEIGRLPENDQRILEAGSLMNVAFPAWAAAAALNGDAMEIEEACEKLARSAHFVQRVGLDELPDGTRCAFYAFTHGIYREVLYQRQSDARRARRHIRIAERLGELFAGREAHVAREMAVHYESAGNWERGAQALRAAAEYAKARHAHAEAAELMERASHLAAHVRKAGDLVEMHRESA